MSGMLIVMHYGGVMQAMVFRGKLCFIALSIKGKPIADGFGQDDCARSRRLLHEGCRRNRGGKGLRASQKIDSSAWRHEIRQVRCETSRLRIVASGIESHIENDVAGRMRAHLIRRGAEEVADVLLVRIRDRLELYEKCATVIDPSPAESAVEVAQRQWQVRVIGNQRAPVRGLAFHLLWRQPPRHLCVWLVLAG